MGFKRDVAASEAAITNRGVRISKPILPASNVAVFNITDGTTVEAKIMELKADESA